MARPEYRKMARIFVPGVFIDRAVQAALCPIVLAAPELEKRLQPHAARLRDMTCPSRLQRWQRAALLWLLEERGTAPEQTGHCDPELSFSQACVPELQDLPPETRRLLWEDFGIGSESAADFHPLQSLPEGVPALPAEDTRGAH